MSKGMPLPAVMQQQLFTSQQSKKPQGVAEAVAAASQVLSNATRAANAPLVDTNSSTKDPKDMFQPEDFDDPWGNKYLKENMTYIGHTSRHSRPYLPSVMPLGVNIDNIRQESETIRHNRIETRKAELEKLSANIGSWDSSRTDVPEDDGRVKRAIIIEQKMLGLLHA